MPISLLSNCTSHQEALSLQIEEVMQARTGTYPFHIPQKYELLGDALTQAFVAQPLLGNVCVTPDERDAIHTAAENILTERLKYLQKGRSLGLDYGLNESDFYRDILVLETALLLRNWSLDEGDVDSDQEEASFWEYLYNQFALSYDGTFSNSHAYNLFRYAIRKSLNKHNRMFIDKGKSFYTTLLIHALAPVTKFRALFDQIYAFYTKTLQYQYLEADPAFEAFVNAMKKRFEGKSALADDDVYIKSVRSSSAIRGLFQCCPQYMTLFVEKIVRGIDTLVADGRLQEKSYLDTLLIDWFEARSRESRVSARQARTRAGTAKPVQAAGAKMTYCYRDGNVLLEIPSIRLIDKSGDIPAVTIYRYPDDPKPYYQELQHFGYFYTTNLEKSIPISNLSPPDAQRIQLRAVVTVGDKTVYDSGAKLYREALVFAAGGKEITKRPDGEYVDIFVTAGSEVHIESLDYTEEPCENGFIYRVLVNDQTQITVNQVDLLSGAERVKDDTLSLSVLPIDGCVYIENQQRYAVFAAAPTLRVRVEDKNSAKQYRVVVDGAPMALSSCYVAVEGACPLLLPDESAPHVLQLINNTTDKVEYMLRYIVIEGIKLNYNGFCYFNNCSGDGSVEISDATGTYRYPYGELLDQGSMLIPYCNGELELDIPTLNCYLDDEPISKDEDRIFWHEDIPMSAVLRVDPPRDYACTTAVGDKVFSDKRIELGNEIRSVDNAHCVPVCVEVCKNAERPVKIQLFSIALQPFFRSEPVVMEGNHLLWCVENNFVGDPASEFHLGIYQDGQLIREFRTECSDAILDMSVPLQDDWYEYVISVKPPGFFTELQELRRGRFTVGEPARLRFHKCNVIIKTAIIDGKHVALKEESAVITNLRYIGECKLNGEVLRYPCYQGKLQDRSGRGFYTYSNQERIRNGVCYEQVNPVKLWYINDYAIALRSPTDDGLYVHIGAKSITDVVPTEETSAFYINPDYYSYKVIR
ncbi:MAG TPA: hypothetical protein GXZ82_13915 [Firmicutes bacterium]|nr:hypothetical protein [Bacillota bacterium]